MAPILSWLRRHDPELNALHKAIKVAIVVTVGLAIGTLVIGNANLSLFASFGGVAFLLFADFPGNRVARFGGRKSSRSRIVAITFGDSPSSCRAASRSERDRHVC